MVAERIENSDGIGYILVAIGAAMPDQERPLVASDGKPDLVDDVKVEISDICNDEWRMVDSFQNWGDQRVARHVVKQPRLVKDRQRQGVRPADRVHHHFG